MRILPESAVGSAAVSMLLTVPVGLGLALLGSKLLTNYGWGLFVALPFAMGFAAATLHGIRQPRSLRSCIEVACLSTGLLAATLLAFAFEGMVCIIMAAPIAVSAGLFGWSVRVPGAAAKRISHGCIGIPFGAVHFCSRSPVDGTRGGAGSANFCRALDHRRACTTGKSLAAGCGFF